MPIMWTFFTLLVVFLLPGFLIIETFFSKLPPLPRWPLAVLLSVFYLTGSTYVLSLLLGYSATTIGINVVLLLGWLFTLAAVKRGRFTDWWPEEHRIAILVTGILFGWYLWVLLPGIFGAHEGYFVMSSVNWQDTAMHLGIIQSISQGNFPPQAPYFSGQPLTYYYFVDFHTAILQTLHPQFAPHLITLSNPFYVAAFFLSVYSLSFTFIRSITSSLVAAFLATFYGNYIWVRLFEYFRQATADGFWGRLQAVLSENTFTIEYLKLLQVPPMADYFLQNRPMMVGLPAAVLVVLLLLLGFRDKRHEYFVLAGIINAMLWQFQLFALGVSLFLGGITILVHANSQQREQLLRALGLFFLSFGLVLAPWLSLAPSQGVGKLFVEVFRWGPWDLDKSLWWFGQFSLVNFGLPWLLFWVSLIFLWKSKQVKRMKVVLLWFWVIGLWFIPHLMTFTLHSIDMHKFFHFMQIGVSLGVGMLLSKISSRWLYSLVLVVVIFSSFSSSLTLLSSYFNKNKGYSQAELAVGRWIREQTPVRSVFITAPTIHNPTTQIGGRLRVLSYTLWPYSHGYFQGDDTVFTREVDIKHIYEQAYDTQLVNSTLTAYEADYIYFGEEERRLYEASLEHFKRLSFYQTVYDRDGIYIFERAAK